MPRRTAPACPDTPPPLTVASTSNFSAGFGDHQRLLDLRAQRLGGEERSNARRLMVICPFRDADNTRAVDVLRRPVP